MKVICAGEMLADILIRSVDQVLFQNDTTQVQEIRVSNGGDANNNAFNFVKLGHQVTYLGRIGCDTLGDYVTWTAREAGVNMDHTVRSNSTGQAKSVILMNSRGDRSFFQDQGTSAEFCFEDCRLDCLDGADLLQLGGIFHLPRFDGGGAANLLREARLRGLITSMDITTDRSGRWKGILDPCYPYLDYFLPSIEQASMVAGTESPPQIAAFFLKRGVKNVVVKLGSRGTYFQNEETAFYAGVYHDLVIVDTTGAGDAFCAGFLTGVLGGKTPVECVTLGTACSAFVIQAPGATAGLRNLEAVRGFIQSRPLLEIQPAGRK